MPEVFNEVRDATNIGLHGEVTITLLYTTADNSALDLLGFVNDDGIDNDYDIHSPATISFATTWDVVLEPNEDITDAYGIPVTSIYQITEETGDTIRTYYIQVPDGAGPYWVGDIMIDLV